MGMILCLSQRDGNCPPLPGMGSMGVCDAPCLGDEAEPWEGTPGLIPNTGKRGWGLAPFPTPLSLLPIPLFSSQILRQFEALCRGQPSPKNACLDSDPSALTVGSAPCTGDLLTDIPLLAGESILTPLNAAPVPVAMPARSEEQGVEAETHGQPGAAVPACPCEQEAVSRLAGDVVGASAPSCSLSLFAGMELVARPGTVLCPDSPPAELRTLSQPKDKQTDVEGSQQTSAFAFLNM